MLIRQTLLYLPAQFLAPAGQFLSMLVWTWWLDPADMGAFVLITASQEFAYLFSLSWFSNYVLRYVPGTTDPAERRRFLGTETTLLALTALPQALAALLAVQLIDGDRSWFAVGVIAAFFISRGLNTHYGERARAESRVLAYTVLQAAGPIGGLAVGIAVVETWGASAVNLLGAYAVAQMVGNLIAVPMIGAAFRPGAIDRAVLTAAFAYGGPMLALNLLSWVAENNVRYVVEHNAGAAAFGLLAVGWGIGRRCASVAAMLVAAAAFPIASRLLNEGNRAAALDQLKINAALLMAVMLPTVAGLALVGDLLTDLAVAEPYRETTKAVLGLSVLAGALRFLHLHVTDQLFVLERRFGYAAIVDLVEIAAMFAFATVGLYYGGLVGVVIGTCFASALAAVVSAALAVGKLGFSFPLADIARIAAATGVMAGCLWITPYPQTGLGLAIAVVSGGAFYTAAMAVLYAHLWTPIARRRLSAA